MLAVMEFPLLGTNVRGSQVILPEPFRTPGENHL